MVAERGSILAQLGGSLASGGLNMAAGYMSASASQKAAEANRQALLEAINQGGQYISRESRVEQEQALLQLRRAQQKEQRTYREATQRADADLYNTFASPMYQAAAGYLQSLFTEGIPQPLAEELAGRIRGAQTARGLESGGAAVQNESRFLASQAAQQRQALLPQLQAMATEPALLRQQLTSSYLQNMAGAQQMGLAQSAGATSALSAAEQMAASRYNTYNSLLGSLTSQMPFSAASPEANMLLAAGTMFGNIGSGLSSLLKPRKEGE